MLVISHGKRKAVNKWLNEKHKPDNTIFYEVGDYNGRDEWQPQDFWCWPGMRLIGEKKPCVRSQIYEVLQCTADSVILKTDGVQIAASSKSICTACRMLHACTYARVQGLTLPGLVVLTDTDNEHFTIRHLNMGISRATHSTLVEIR